MTRGTFEAKLVGLLRSHHPHPPSDLAEQVRSGVMTMIEAAVRSAGDGGLRPEVIYAIRTSKLAARILPPEVYRSPERRAEIKEAIRRLIRSDLNPGVPAESGRPDAPERSDGSPS